MNRQNTHTSARRRGRNVLSSTAAVLTLALLGISDTADAQVFNLAGPSNSRGYHQASSRRNMVRFHGHLYAAIVQQDGRVEIRRKVDDVISPWLPFVGAVNTLTTGIDITHPTTTASMAVTGVGAGASGGALHITWGCYYYPTYYQQYYRCFRIGTGFTHAVQDITAMVGATTTTRTDSMAIAVGPANEVYMSAQHGTDDWRSCLLHSQFVGFPVGAAPLWTDRGSIAGNTASSKNVRMVVDAMGNVQMSFYNNIGNGEYATRVFSPPTTWNTQEQIGVPPAPRDACGYLASDYSRYTHVLYKHLVSVSGTVTNFELQYRRRTGTSPWSAPIVVDAFTSADVGPNTPRHSYALAATTKGDRVFAIYRDYTCRRMMVKQKKLWEPSFEFLAKLYPSSSVTNDYYMPNVRNTLFPRDNGLYAYLDVGVRHPAGGTFRMSHTRLHVANMDVNLTGCPGSVGVPAMAYGGVPCSPNPHVVGFGLENANPGSMAFLLWTLSSTMSFPFAGCNLYANNILTTATVSSCSTAGTNISLPPGCYGITLYNQWAVLDPGATFGWALTNRGQIRL